MTATYKWPLALSQSNDTANWTSQSPEKQNYTYYKFFSFEFLELIFMFLLLINMLEI